MRTALVAQLHELPGFLAGHVQLTLVALLAGLVVSLPLGIAATRRPRLGAAALGVASVLQTIPGLALLALMVPLLGALGVAFAGLGWPAPPSIGFLPAALALSLYSVLPILRNTVTGIAGVDPALCEAARGVGMSPREVLWQVELPLAMPTIAAGVRTATVWVVGTATLATPVGGTSLGNPIFAGLQTRNLSAVLVGSLAAAGLAILLDGLVRALERGLERRSRPAVLAPLAAIALLAAWSLLGSAGVTGAGAAAASRSDAVTIGSKTFTEQYVLTEILAGVLEATPAVKARRVPSLGSTVAFDALVAGDLDLYVDYSGTVWSTILGRSGVGVDRAQVLREVREQLARRFDVRVLASLGFENTYCLAMRERDAARLGVRRISDLAPHTAGLEILGDFEFFGRPEWQALESRYALSFERERAMDSSLLYEALRSGSGDVISAYSTDGRIEAYGLRVLEDDLGVIPPYDAIVLASGDFAERRPGLARSLAALEGRIPAAEMRRLNAAVDLDGASPADAAADWLGRCLAAVTGSSPGPECGAPVPPRAR